MEETAHEGFRSTTEAAVPDHNAAWFVAPVGEILNDPTCHEPLML